MNKYEEARVFFIEMVGEGSSPEKVRAFSDILESAYNNPVLHGILSEPKDILRAKLEKLIKAKLMFQDAIYKIITEEWITHPDMSLDKIAVIAQGDIEYDVG